MLLIPCPWCGERPQTDFTYGGDGTVVRPAEGAPRADWAGFVFTRDNPMGPHLELWHHSAGCRRWLLVERDTLTHDITGSRKPGEVAP